MMEGKNKRENSFEAFYVVLIIKWFLLLSQFKWKTDNLLGLKGQVTSN